MDLQWWIAVIAVPVLGGLVTAIVALWRSQKTGEAETKKAASEGDKALHRRVDDLLEKIGEHRHEAAMTYVTKNDFQEDFKRLEARFEGWMERVEQKLDSLLDGRPKGGR
jgi:hypothetical protein